MPLRFVSCPTRGLPLRVCAVMVVLLHMAYSASAGMLVGECEAIEWLNSGGLSPTAQLQAAVDGCCARFPNGATLVMPKKSLLVGSIVLCSNLTLVIPVGAQIVASQEPDLFPFILPLPSYGEARDNSKNTTVVRRPLLYAPRVRNLVLTGGGEVIGNGAPWWKAERNGTLEYQRPRLFQCVNASDVKIMNLKFQDSPFWTLHIVYSYHVLISGCRIEAPRDSPNTDGIDVDSSSGVTIFNNSIDVGDDAVAVKSGLNAAGRAFGRPSSDITIRYNRIWGKAIAIGSEMSGGVYNVLAEFNEMGDPAGSVTGYLIKSSVPRGGAISDIVFRNSVIHNASQVFSWIPVLTISEKYSKHPGPPAPEDIPTISNVLFSNITIDYAEQIGCLQGLVERPPSNIVFESVIVKNWNMGWSCNNSIFTNVSTFPPVCPSGSEQVPCRY